MKEINYVFGALEEADVDALMRIGTQERLHVSDQLLTEGTHHDAIYLVLDGELSVSVKGRNAPRRARFCFEAQTAVRSKVRWARSPLNAVCGLTKPVRRSLLML